MSAEIGSRIKQLREALGKTQAEFAELLDKKGHPVIAKWEGGKRQIRHSDILLITHLTSVNANWLLTGEGEMFLGRSKDTPPFIPPPKSGPHFGPFAAALGYYLDKSPRGTQTVLARMANVSTTYIAMLRNGDSVGSVNVRFSIASFFRNTYPDFLAFGHKLLGFKEPFKMVQAPFTLSPAHLRSEILKPSDRVLQMLAMAWSILEYGETSSRELLDGLIRKLFLADFTMKVPQSSDTAENHSLSVNENSFDESKS